MTKITKKCPDFVTKIIKKCLDFVTAVRNDVAFRRTKQMPGKSPRDKSKVPLQISRKNFKVKLISGFSMATPKIDINYFCV